jgi:hypothetical protein
MSSLIINGVNLCATFIAVFAADRFVLEYQPALSHEHARSPDMHHTW